jgi:enoyl-CoA hydratase/carnithine racemase
MSTVVFNQQGTLGEIVLCDPPLNLLGAALIADLRAAVAEAKSSSARAILIRADGDNFSAGADVNLFRGQSEADGQMFLGEVFETVEAIESLAVPTLAAVHGLCLAGGMEVALACDLIWAAEGTMLGQPEATIGAIPFAGATQRLAARAGTARALEMVYTGGFYPAERMLDWGVLNRVVAAPDLLAKARAFAQRLADGPTLAHAATKEIIRSWGSDGVAAADALTITAGARIIASTDLQNGVESLLTAGPGKAAFQNC